MSPCPTSSVAVDLRIRLLPGHGEGVPVLARLRYDSFDPYAVTMEFRSRGAAAVTWTFALELLARGLTARAGEGDVQVWPTPAGTTAGGGVRLSLSSPAGSASFELPRAAVTGFVSAAEDVLRAGAACVMTDLDAELALLTWSGADD